MSHEYQLTRNSDMLQHCFPPVIPAQAGIQKARLEISWIPACAGMTS